MIEVESDKEFEDEVIQQEGQVIVQFHATWCAPCKALAPRFEAASNRGSGRWVRADIDKLDFETLRTLGIQSVPTIMEFDGGEFVKIIKGRTADAILEEI